MVLKQLSMRLPNRPGALAGVARLLAEQRINLAAISVDSSGEKGNVRLVVSDPDRAQRTLKKAGYAVVSKELLAIHLEDRAGSFLRVLEVLALAKVNIRSVVILVAREGSETLVAIEADNLPKTRKSLSQSGYISRTAERLVTNADLLAGVPAIPAESVGLLL
ncbi:MAG: ACT domain-containing protein [Thermoplasmata archaeon]|nr:ACT domain-containing protein [Thermoplasmata archaeon]